MHPLIYRQTSPVPLTRCLAICAQLTTPVRLPSMASSQTFTSPFAAVEAQDMADTDDPCDTSKANSGTVHVLVKTTWKNQSCEGEEHKCCMPRVDSLVLAEKRLAHCKKRPGHVVDQLHANEKTQSVFKRSMRFVSTMLHLPNH
jgi:hypothetical protein